MKVILTLLLTFVLMLAACTKKEPEQNADEHGRSDTKQAEKHADSEENLLHVDPSMMRDLNITTSKVEQRDGGETASMLGEVRVNESAYAEVGAPVASRVVDVHATPGASVVAGQALATLQSTELGKSRADYIKAQSRLELAEKTLERKRRLVGERIVAQREVHEAEAEVQSARAEVRASQASLKALGSAGSEATDSPQYVLRSPVRGVVIERAAVRGQMADPAKPLFRVGDLSTVWLNVHAFERDAVRVKTGTVARVVFPALPGRTFTGNVTLVGREVESESRTIPVRIEIANRDGMLRPGMSATAFMVVGQGDAKVLSVPAPALQRIQERWIVFVPADEEGAFDMREVGRGRDLGGEVEILTGLKAGESIVLEGAFMLKAQAEKARGGGEEHEH
jgi:cobalt-zinc-cadmium efflux system membrane fusion protein